LSGPSIYKEFRSVNEGRLVKGQKQSGLRKPRSRSETMRFCHAAVLYDMFITSSLSATSGRLSKTGDGQANFDFVAAFYPLLEQLVFGSTLSRARSFFIAQAAQGKNVLLIGEGNGRFLLETVMQTSTPAFTVVDSSARMLSAAARRAARIECCPKIEFFHADILDWQPALAHYDRIVTHFVLDLYRPYSMRRIIEKISRLATEDALWINVDFSNANQRLCQSLLMWAQYRFFRICAGIEAPRLFDSGDYFREAGWQIIESRTIKRGWIVAHLMSKQQMISLPATRVSSCFSERRH
jgi:ubiquinone/menaquinone biosynthesis C-methylase UbiE